MHCQFGEIGHTDGIIDFDIHGDSLVSVSTGNRLGVHSDIHGDLSFVSTRFRQDTIRGQITKLKIMKTSGLTIVGQDSGAVTVFA